eukprot:scaffold36065_cov54-Phaeocystis_antarctica.AAC.3
MLLTAERLGGRLGESLTERTSCERVRFLGVLPGGLDAMAAACSRRRPARASVWKSGVGGRLSRAAIYTDMREVLPSTPTTRDRYIRASLSYAPNARTTSGWSIGPRRGRVPPQQEVLVADVAHLGRRSVSHIDQDAVPGLVPPVWQAVDPHLCDPSRIHCASVVGRADDDAAVAELAVLHGVARSMQHHQRVELAVARYGREQALRLEMAADGVGVRGELPPPIPSRIRPSQAEGRHHRQPAVRPEHRAQRRSDHEARRCGVLR